MAGWNRDHAPDCVTETTWTGPNDECGLDVPAFCADANAVLPWLEKEHEVSKVFECGEWFVGIERSVTHEGSFASATAKTLARAAVIALLRAKRAQKGAP